jgi:hypothetical protein
MRFLDHLNGLQRNNLETEKGDHFLCFTSTSVGHRMAPWAALFTGNLPTQAFIRTMDHIIIIPTKKPFLQPCHADKIARRLWQDKLHNESKSFKTTIRENGYSLKQTSRFHDPTGRTSKPKEKPSSVTILPLMQTTYGRLKRMLSLHNQEC